MKNCISINLRKDEIIIKISENAEQIEIERELKRKLPELKRLYQDEKTPIRVVGKVLKNKEIDRLQKIIEEKLKTEVTK